MSLDKNQRERKQAESSRRVAGPGVNEPGNPLSLALACCYLVITIFFVTVAPAAETR